MTCIIGIECTDGAIIGGDLAGSNGHTSSNVTQSKIFEHSGIIIGYTSTFRFGQILECLLDDNTLYPPSDPDQTYGWLIRQFVPKVKKTLDDNHCKEGIALLAINSQLWMLQSDMSVLRNTSGCNAIGSGEEYAMGSVLTSLEHIPNLTITAAKGVLDVAFRVTGGSVVSVSQEYTYQIQEK